MGTQGRDAECVAGTGGADEGEEVTSEQAVNNVYMTQALCEDTEEQNQDSGSLG